MAKVVSHNNNMLKLWMPCIWTASLSVLMLAVGVLAGDFTNDLAVYFFCTAVALGMAALPVSVSCIARMIEYDRMRTEILRGSARSIGNPRIDKLINRFYATPARQYVCALALSTMDMGLSEEDSLAQVQRIHTTRRKRLVPPTFMSRDWWLAHFTPVDLS